MKGEDFDLLSRIVRERSGLVLTPDKVYLLESRLPAVAKRFGHAGLDGLVAALRLRNDSVMMHAVTEAMTTNETFFFRDTKPFEQFRTTILPTLLEARAARKSLRIWCAAASTGQEPYSLAMICAEQKARLAGWKVEIVATDISDEVLARAKAGIYNQFEVQRGLPVQLLARYFDKLEDCWQLKPEIRNAVQYRSFNLLEEPHALGRFDVVFCRNVLIYFDPPTKQRVLQRIAGLLPSDGFLLLGAAETVLGVSDRFAPLAAERGLYRPVTAPAAPQGPGVLARTATLSLA